MFQNAAVDIAIGLILMYLVLSLVCTVINEYIATRCDLRSKSLAAGLQALLDDPVVRNAFYDHGLIAGAKSALAKSSQVSLMRPAPALTAPATQPGPAPVVVPAAPEVAASRTAGPRGGAAGVPPAAPPGATSPAAPIAETQPGEHPSYISAETFVLALIGSLTGTHLAQGQVAPGFPDVQSAIQNLPPSKIKSALLASLMTAQGDFATFRKSVATWFDDSMERLSGAYKRHLKLISIVVGCGVAVIVNADTFAVGKALWSDSALRAQMVQVAEQTARAGQEPGDNPTPDTIAKAFTNANETLRPLPIGWPRCADVNQRQSYRACLGVPDWAKLLGRIPGWFLTGLALSLGAPFWFDLLSKFINIRGAGAKPERQDKK